MGLFGLGTAKGKSGGIMNVIRCDEPEYLVWKWRPAGQDANTTSRENSIRYGSSLRVKDGEVAVFVYKQKDGAVQDFIVGPYDDTIKTANFPILASIVGLAFGGESPFQAEVYFINLQGNNQVKFAIPYFDVVDPRLPDFPVPVAVRGAITFALEDYRSFIKLNRLIDFDLEAFKKQIKDVMMRKIKGIVTNVPSDLGMPIVLMERKIDEISELLETRLKDRLDEYGVSMKHIDINAIEIDKDSDAYARVKGLTADITARTMQAQANLNIKNLQDVQALNTENMKDTMRIQREEGQYAQHLQTQQLNMGAYTAGLQADVLKTGAQSLGKMGTINLGGGNQGGMNPAGMMTGMMMGGAMGQQMAGMMNNMGQQMQNAMNTPPPMPEIQYMVSANGQQSGPFNMQQLQQMVQTGVLTPQTYVWKQGMPQWEFAGNVQELASLFAAPAPPPVPGGMPTPPTP
ncbi:MAG: SPFH domain-containing protein [Bacteroidaceae bacterium]|nr:SPFH domain-containing protein [Bacteroidaceae bacterium]